MVILVYKRARPPPRRDAMTAIRGYVPPITDREAVGVHSLDHFVLAVPALKPAQDFYKNFGLDVREDGSTLALNTFGHDHRWGLVVEGKRKRLHHLSFGCYGDARARLRARVEGNGVALLDPPAGFASNGFWFRDPSGVLIEVKVATKSSPDRKVGGTFTSAPEGVAGAPYRRYAPATRPRRLSHVLIFTPDIDASIEFYAKNLGLRLSDRADSIAFMHGINGRHVLGSNYFRYVQDPWGSFAEYSCDIDYIPRTQQWQAQRHKPEDALSLWGPHPPDYFIFNAEAVQ